MNRATWRSVFWAIWMVAFVILLRIQGVGAQAVDGGGLVPTEAENVVRWGLVVGFIMPLVIDVIKQTGWSSTAKGLAAFVLCAVAAVGTAWIKGEVSRTDVVSSFLAIFLTSQANYNFWWKHMVGDRLARATSFGRE